MLANLAVSVAQIINSELAEEHAAEADFWAFEWVSNNDAGGGACSLEGWKPGSEITFKRFVAWKSGTLPAFEQVIVRKIASPGTRRALLERGDADFSFNLPPKDFSELVVTGKLNVIGTPVDAELLYLKAVFVEVENGLANSQKCSTGSMVRKKRVSHPKPLISITTGIPLSSTIPLQIRTLASGFRRWDTEVRHHCAKSDVSVPV